MLEEYRIASDGKVVVEIVDPQQDPEKELEANQTYGIQPTALQAADRYGASVVNAYFDILVRYGDQYETLNFIDLIEIQSYPSGDVDVRLRNLEYDLTRAIKKTVFGFQSIDSVLASLEEPVKMTLYVTPSTLPEWFQQAPENIQKVAGEIESTAENGNFVFEVVNLEDPSAPFTRELMMEQYGMGPIPVGLFSDQSYYLHIAMQIGDEQQWLFPSGDFSEASIQTAVESAIKRVSPGFLKTVGLWTPPATPTQGMLGQPQPSLKQYNEIGAQLRRDYTVQPVDLSDGQAPAGLDVLVVIAPQNMTGKEQYAIDQFLMRGGSVVVAAGNYVLNPDQFTGEMGVQLVSDGVSDMLKHYGVSVSDSMVLDPQNEPFPVQVSRDLGGFEVREIQAISYPYFVDVRQPDGMDQDSPILANLSAVTMHWVSPLEIDQEANADREVTVLLSSTPYSWVSTDTDVTPDLELFPQLGFPVDGEQESYPLAVSVHGTFDSFFKDKPSPWETDPGPEGDQDESAPQTVGTIERSPEMTRLVVIGSAEFLNDVVFDLSMPISGDRFLNSLQFMQNAVDWSVEDLDLLDIRARGTWGHMLKPLNERSQSLWEAANYLVALMGLVAIGAVWHARQRNEKPMELMPRDELYGDDRQPPGQA